MGEVWPKSETELAKVVVDYLADMGWDIYQEVVGVRGRADIVAVRGPLVWVIETKKTLGLGLLAQGAEWRPWTNMVSLAFPASAKRGFRSQARGFAVTVAKSEGLGLLEVSEPSDYREWVKELVRPVLNRRPLDDLRKKLEPEHKTFAEAGNADGKFWSPFKRTCKLLREFVEGNPGCTIKDAIAEIKHHYASPASAAGSLRDLIDKGVVDGVTLHKFGPGGGPWRLYPDGHEVPVGCPSSLMLFGGGRE